MLTLCLKINTLGVDITLFSKTFVSSLFLSFLSRKTYEVVIYKKKGHKKKNFLGWDPNICKLKQTFIIHIAIR